MIPNPIHKVLSLIQAHQVQALLMGGQACVLYGGAEFSRDIDLVFVVDPENLARFNRLLSELQARCIALPPFEVGYLEKGHAVHFRCSHPDAAGVRIDVMSRLRGVDSFEQLWLRRSTVDIGDGLKCEVVALPDLVKAKKTQRDKDWPMIRRLLEANYFQHRDKSDEPHIRFWLLELRTPELLIEVAQAHKSLAQEIVPLRQVLAEALAGNVLALKAGLLKEEQVEKEKDVAYWTPLKKELEELRRKQ